MKRYGWFVILIAVMLSGCAETEVPSFVETDCDFWWGAGEEYQCGTLLVPEDRSREDSPMIKLQVAILRSSHAEPEPDPVLILMGGPGMGSLDSNWDMMFRKMINRDVIIFDQRGAGYSQPSLNCPEMEEPYYRLLGENLSTAEKDQKLAQMLQACHDRLVSEGINPAAYTSAAGAADVDDLRRALGIEEWNLYGPSYGSRLALTVMRDYPKGVRSVILESNYPPQVDLYGPMAANGERSLNLIFDTCSNDPACSQAYPDLRRVFYGLVDQLDAQPVTLEISRPGTEEVYPLVMNGDRLINVFFDLLYGTSNLPILPGLVYDLAAGDWDNLPGMIRGFQFFPDYLYEGMHYAVQCSEEAYFGAPDTALTDLSEYSARWRKAMNSQSIYDLCEGWDIQSPSRRENKAVRSKIPTLILAGEYDPITPPAWGVLSSETVGGSQFFIFPGMGHGVLESNVCPFRMARDFLDAPTSEFDSGCMERLDLDFQVDH